MLGAVQLEGVGADRELGGLLVVQCVVTLDGGLAAAACGRSLFTLRLSTSAHAKPDGGALHSAAARPALPSMVVSLSAAADGSCLVAATTSAGVFVWSGAALADPSAAASRMLSFHGSCVATALSPAGDCCIAACTDQTVRIWDTESLAVAG